MSNEYKDWAKERQEQAWEDILEIAEICAQEDTEIENKYFIIEGILTQGGWL